MAAVTENFLEKRYKPAGMVIGYINAQQIPKYEGNMIGSLLFTTMSEYFADPQHQKEFEEWMRSRETVILDDE